MTLLIGFLTFVLVLTCLLLMLLILIQLPKKESGAGLAFGGTATDALFGAGTGTALTKMTRYTATFFVGLAIALSVMHMSVAREGGRLLELELQRQATTAPAAPLAPTVEQTTPGLLNVPPAEAGAELPLAPATPPAAPPAPPAPPTTPDPEP
jgi:preprotein translocase subunit SecG